MTRKKPHTRPAEEYVGTYQVIHPSQAVFYPTIKPAQGRAEDLMPNEFLFGENKRDARQVKLRRLSEPGTLKLDRIVTLIVADSVKCRWTSEATYLIPVVDVGTEHHSMKLRVDLKARIVWIEK